MREQNQMTLNTVLPKGWCEGSLIATDTIPTPDCHGFAQRERDPESSLMHFRARSYDSRTGRFQQRDPITSNRPTEHYRYAANRPTKLTDPTGRKISFNWDEQQGTVQSIMMDGVLSLLRDWYQVDLSWDVAKSTPLFHAPIHGTEIKLRAGSRLPGLSALPDWRQRDAEIFIKAVEDSESRFLSDWLANIFKHAPQLMNQLEVNVRDAHMRRVRLEEGPIPAPFVMRGLGIRATFYSVLTGSAIAAVVAPALLVEVGPAVAIATVPAFSSTAIGPNVAAVAASAGPVAASAARDPRLLGMVENYNRLTAQLWARLIPPDQVDDALDVIRELAEKIKQLGGKVP